MHLRLFVPLIFSFASAQSELLIGVVQSLSTPLQRTAVSLFNFTVNELNANGSFPLPIRLIIRDSKDLIRGAIALLGEWSSSNPKHQDVVLISSKYIASRYRYVSLFGSALLKCDYPSLFKQD
jgi:hypothetical protein